MPKSPAFTTRRLHEKTEVPYSVLTSTSLTDHKTWNSSESGKYTVVRLNFLAEIGHVAQPKAFIESMDVEATTQGAKKAWSPVGPLDFAKTAPSLVTDELKAKLAYILKDSRGGADPSLSRKALTAEIKTACVDDCWRNDDEVVHPNRVPVRRLAAQRVPIRGGRERRALLVGERHVTLYLAYVDYMFVDYKVKFAGHNLLRSKYPPFHHGGIARLNELHMDGIPYAKLRVFEVLQVGTPSRKHVPLDADALDWADVIEPGSSRTYARQELKDKVASLHSVANPAFPLPREFARLTWSEDDLIELPPGPDTRRIPSLRRIRTAINGP